MKIKLLFSLLVGLIICQFISADVSNEVEKQIRKQKNLCTKLSFMKLRGLKTPERNFCSSYLMK